MIDDEGKTRDVQFGSSVAQILRLLFIASPNFPFLDQASLRLRRHEEIVCLFERTDIGIAMEVNRGCGN